MKVLINTMPGRIGAAFLGIAMAITLAAPATTARAQSIAELQAQINQLIEVLAQLQAGTGQTGGTIDGWVCPANVWQRDLSIGSTGPDVRALQTFLNSKPTTRLALSGPGSPGNETAYYGPLTAASVSDFQVMFRTQILTPIGLVNPTGYFGAMSRTQANTICTGDVDVPPDDDEDEDEDDELRGGEASLEDFDVSDEDTNLSEGDEEAEVMNVEFDVENGDIRINRIDVAFDHISGGDDDPWDVFDRAYIMVDGDTVGEVDLSDEDDWDEDDPNTGDYRIRFSDLDTWIVREGETAEFTIALDVAGSVDDADTGVEWEIFIPDEGIRATDGLGINNYIGDTDDTVSFDIEEEGFEDELIVRSSADDPEATTLELESNDTSDWITVFAFDLDTDDSRNDIELESMPITVTFSTSTFDTFVNDARIVVNGDTFDDYTLAGGGSASATTTFNFDNDDFVIDAGERVTVEFQLEFEALDDNNLEGATVEAEIDADNIEAEGADDLDDTQTSGSASSEEHTLRTIGVTISAESTSTTVRENDTAADTGIFTIRFEVTAFEEDVYINRSAASGTGEGTAGANFLVEDSNGDQVGAGTSNAVLSSSAPVSGNRFRVNEGETETFTLSVSYTPTSDGFYRAQLYSVNFNDTNANPDVWQRALPTQNFETDYENLDS